MTDADLDRFMPDGAIERRNNSKIWTARIKVPKELHRVLGSADKKRSLKTTNEKEANARLVKVRMDFAREFAEKARINIPDDIDLLSQVQHYAVEREDEDEEFRQTWTYDDDEIEAARRLAINKFGYSEHAASLLADDIAFKVKHGLEHRKAERDRIKEALKARNEAAVFHDAMELVRRNGWNIGPGSQEFKQLSHFLLRMHADVARIADARDEGNYTTTFSDPILTKPALRKGSMIARPGETLIDYFQKYKRKTGPDTSEETWIKNERIVRVFADFAGPERPVNTLTRQDVHDFLEALDGWPIKATETAEFKGLRFRDIIEVNKRLKQPKPIISDKTKNSYLAGLGSFFRWLTSMKHVQDDLMFNVYLSVDKKTKKVFPYSADQLTTIFDSPLFRGCQNADDIDKPGNHQVRDWRYWLPLLAIYTGARLGELCQLECKDIKEAHGIDFIHITDDGGDDNKSVKNEGSIRVIPVHDELKRLGFVTFAAKAKGKGSRLFPQIVPDARGSFAGRPSALLNKYLRDIGVKTDRRHNFHSFRHNTADAFRMAGLEDDDFGQLLGHTQATTTNTYGVLKAGPLKDRYEKINSIAYPSIDLSGLYESI